MNASISVITASLNAYSKLPRLVDSLRKQADKDFEYVVMDGGSTDGTLEYVRDACDVVSRLVSEPDHGIYDALNRAIRDLQTEYYLVVGADDVLFPDAIARYKAAVMETGADVVVAGVKVGPTLRRGYYPRRAWLGHAAMVTSHSVGMLFRKSLHDTFGEYSLRYPMQADGHFIKRACMSKAVRVIAADFIAGEFGQDGFSNRDLARALCETWQIQRDTGENPLIQYLLFQLRLLKNLPRIVGKR